MLLSYEKLRELESSVGHDGIAQFLLEHCFRAEGRQLEQVEARRASGQARLLADTLTRTRPATTQHTKERLDHAHRGWCAVLVCRECERGR